MISINKEILLEKIESCVDRNGDVNLAKLIYDTEVHLPELQFETEAYRIIDDMATNSPHSEALEAMEQHKLEQVIWEIVVIALSDMEKFHDIGTFTSMCMAKVLKAIIGDQESKLRNNMTSYRDAISNYESEFGPIICFTFHKIRPRGIRRDPNSGIIRGKY